MACPGAAYHKTNQHGRTTYDNMWEVRHHLRHNIELCDAMDENATIQEALPEHETDDAIKAIDAAKQFEVKGGRACRKPRCQGRPYGGAQVEGIILELEAEQPEQLTFCVGETWDIPKDNDEKKQHSVDLGKFLHDIHLRCFHHFCPHACANVP